MTEYNKVVYDGHTLIDLTQDDVQASDVRNGVYFHSANGVRSQGTLASTSVPTADTIAEWDSDVHMNSEDMTSQEIEDFIDGLNVSGGGNEIDVKCVTQNCTFISGKSYVDISYTLPTGATILIMALNGRPNADWIYADISAYGSTSARIAYNNTYSTSLSGDVVLNILYKK